MRIDRTAAPPAACFVAAGVALEPVIPEFGRADRQAEFQTQLNWRRLKPDRLSSRRIEKKRVALNSLVHLRHSTLQVARETRERLIRDRAHLVRALHDCQRGKAPALSEVELAALLEGIGRRLQEIEKKLNALDPR